MNEKWIALANQIADLRRQLAEVIAERDALLAKQRAEIVTTRSADDVIVFKPQIYQD